MNVCAMVSLNRQRQLAAYGKFRDIGPRSFAKLEPSQVKTPESGLGPVKA